MIDYSFSQVLASKSKKRFDLTVKVMPLFGKNWTFSLRILSNVPYHPNQAKQMAKYVAKNQSEWKPREGYEDSYTFSLKGYAANAIINPEAKRLKPQEPKAEVATETKESPKEVKAEPTPEPIDPITQPLKE